MPDDFYTEVYNPDVLSCLANLSNDEVFTPPGIANQMLDLLPQELFSNPDTKFLDPACKSGVFLREIAKRLLTGLEPLIPDLQQRIDHIFQQQLYGIAITELTSLLCRRGVYCSKYPNSIFSVARFDDAEGNICFKRVQHTWKNGRCVFCGANRSQYERGDQLETHAYEFIHNLYPERIFDMKFDVIIGNPPYQLNDGGGTGSSAMPMYQKFVDNAIKLKPRYLSMIIPSRWFSGGRGLDDFRDRMLNDTRIREIHDFTNADDCFPGINLEGGVNYFLWDRDNSGDAKIFSHDSNGITSATERPLLEKGNNTFIRYNQAVPIVKKIHSYNERRFSEIVSANDPFGFDSRENDSYKRVKPIFNSTNFPNSVKFYYYGWEKNGIGFIDRNKIKKNVELVNKIKVYISKAYGMGKTRPYKVINSPFIGDINTCCTETYLVIGPFNNQLECDNVISYIKTKFFRFLVILIKNTQNAMQKVYSLVPMQDFSKLWTDEELYAKYGLTDEEIAFIESIIKPMDLTAGNDDAE